MTSGPWHQCGHNSQKIVLEELQHGRGKGVVLSPRDLAFANAEQYSLNYRDLGAEVAWDPQYYLPGFTNSRLASYPDLSSRRSAAALGPFTRETLTELRDHLVEINRTLGASFVIAPAAICEAASPETIALNRQMFRAAKLCGESLDLPTFATLFIGASAAASETSTTEILSSMTSLAADGWYFGFEFPSEERLPMTRALVKRCLEAILRLACTGKPVFHAYSGPMSVLSVPVGATHTGIGHCPLLWHFHRRRWEVKASTQQGGGDAPPRFFSRSLWGTLVYPDETRQLSTPVQASVLVHSPFSGQVASGLPWRRWDAYKHSVSVICDEVDSLVALGDAQTASAQTRALLQSAITSWNAVQAEGIDPRDGAANYQSVWQAALDEIANENAEDYAFMALLKP